MLQVDDLHFHQWFPDGKINITEQCLDVHLKDRPNQIAYFIESPITNSVLIDATRDRQSHILNCMDEYRRWLGP